ncbi:hypothetical protein V2J09_010354 [Rumex salicifolius]
MAARVFACFAIFVAMASMMAYATDPNQLQDFCQYGTVCERAFLQKIIIKSRQTTSYSRDSIKPATPMGSAVTPVVASNLGGLNTLRISLARLDFAPKGLVAPHFHPRATEVLTLLEGTLYVGFVTSNPPMPCSNKLFTKVLYPGDMFFNAGDTKAFSISALSSQNPGVTTIANAVFRSEPPISVDVLSKAFQLDANVIKYVGSVSTVPS